MIRIEKFLLFVFLLGSLNLLAQDKELAKIINWYNGPKQGMSTDLAYKKLLAGKKSEPVVVAVIDSGVDIEHQDLKDRIWVNKDEIPDNGIDDDKNGYIDDVYGWSFLGNPDGEDVEHEQLEVTRIYARLHKKFDGVNESDVADADKADYELYQEVKGKVESELETSAKNLTQYEQIMDKMEGADAMLKKANDGADYTLKDLKKLKKSDDKEVAASAEMMSQMMSMGLTMKRLQGAIDHFKGSSEYHYTPEFDARAVVGDNPADFNDKYYGCNDVEGPDAFHGTHCAGIIGAVRGNGIGGDGVADNVLIMSVRAVPDGDERDKDIALAIRYAVDNGAQVCNMSFGKSYSSYPDEVIEAIKYAEEKGVLLVHAAGNSNMDTEKNSNYPSPQYPGMTERFTNWIEVGASTRYEKPVYLEKDGKLKKYSVGLAASFSNYSDKVVDIFAPGLEIYSTVPQSDYAAIQGTSMAAPMVAGLAALLKSYFPELTMFQIKDIILKSGQDLGGQMVFLPGTHDEIEFKKLSRTGMVANVYNAVEMAMGM